MSYLFFINKSQATNIEFPALEVLVELFPDDLLMLTPLDFVAEVLEPHVFAGTPDTTLDLPVLDAVAILETLSIETGLGERTWWYYDMMREGE